MAGKCGCDSGADNFDCNCIVRGDGGVTVTGAGTVRDPYLVALDAPTAVVGKNSDTIATNVENDGGAYAVTSDAILSEDAGNVLIKGSDGALFAKGAAATPERYHYYQTVGQLLAENGFDKLNFDAADKGQTPPGTDIPIGKSGIWTVDASYRLDGAAETGDGGTGGDSGGRGDSVDVAADRVVLWIAKADDHEARLTSTAQNQFPNPVPSPSVRLTETIELNEGDTIAAWALQKSGADRETETSWNSVRITLTWLGPINPA